MPAELQGSVKLSVQSAWRSRR